MPIWGIALIAFGIVVGVTVVGVVVVGAIFASENNAGCAGQDCNEGFALLMILAFMGSLIIGTFVAVVTSTVLIVRRRGPGRRLTAATIVIGVALAPLAWIVWELI